MSDPEEPGWSGKRWLAIAAVLAMVWLVAQILGAAAATALFGWLVPTIPNADPYPVDLPADSKREEVYR